MGKCIGIRNEDRYVMERRVPLTPKHIERLIKDYNLKFAVQSSPKRIFKDAEFENAGAIVTDNLNICDIIIGVKEMPINLFEENKTYVFFSHVIKGQSRNMPMLKKMMEKKCNLIDYEKITDELGRRLIFFGKFAGLAGMINTLWSYGMRLKHFGIENPFTELKQSYKYDSLDEAKRVISNIGTIIAEKGLPEALRPMTIGITGYGNVSQGVQEICSYLPTQEISPSDLLDLKNRCNLPKNIIYKTVFKEEDLSEPIDKLNEFDLRDYYLNPQGYKNKFEKYVPDLSMLVNCIYWDERYPRIITKNYLKELYKNKRPKLTVIGDISCDIEGSIESTLLATEIEHPVFVYNPFTQQITNGFTEEGMLTMSVDILPSELPRESSLYFGEILINYIHSLSLADFSKSYGDLNLPSPIKKALILHNGELTNDYKYLSKFIN